MGQYIAVDLGASNGRTILGRFDGEKLTLKELTRFENSCVRVGDGYYWNILHLYTEIIEGLRLCTKNGGICGIGIDTWGVDFGLVDRQGGIIGSPRSYRDPRGGRGMNTFHVRHGEKTAFDITGIANVAFNTLYQLYDMADNDDPALEVAEKLLLMPDLLGYMLCGTASTEYTNATTTQMLDCRTGRWSKELLGMTGLPSKLFSKIQMSGTVKDKLLPSIAAETGLKACPPVICVGSHDTASAAAAIPGSGSFAFCSSGTWSLFGVETDKAILTEDVYRAGFSNEGTVQGGFCPLKNIMGLWLIQECRRDWHKKCVKLSWGDIVIAADSELPFRSIIDPTYSEFFSAGHMEKKIQTYCRNTKQPVPKTVGQVARCIYESLALIYRWAVEHLEAIKGMHIDTLNFVGGGVLNRFLNQMAADATNRRVITGPIEGACIGNLMMQAMAMGEVSGIAEAREVIRHSFDTEEYEPHHTQAWEDAYHRMIGYMEEKND